MELFKFEPLLKQTIWGGNKIVAFKHIKSDMKNVGESWEVSGVPGDESGVANGACKGKTLNEVLAEMKQKLVGEENYKRFGDRFPLLIKFIDARQDLSIQVHPDDETAHRQGKAMGKTEMWYVMDSDEDASLKVGLKKKITPEEYARMVEDDTICDALGNYKVKSGDCFFIPAGRIHAICSGSFIAEIQQTSDVTYRIYDYKRKDKDGNYRQLHTKEAAEAIDYNVYSNYKTDYVPSKNQGIELVRCPYFNTAVYDLDQPMTLDYSELDSFVIIVGLKGKGSFVDNEGNETIIEAGETVLIPASTKTLKMTGTLKFLETYV